VAPRVFRLATVNRCKFYLASPTARRGSAERPHLWTIGCSH